jgi:hypothetical protein
MFRRDGGFWLVVGAKVRPWSFTGYGAAQPLPTGQVDVLTPEPSVRALRAGYGLHPS